MTCSKFSVKLSNEADVLHYKLRNETDIRNIALIALKLFNLGRNYRLRCEATRYSERDGSVVDTDWRPSEKWDGNLWIGYSMNGEAIYEGQHGYETLALNVLPDSLAVSIVETEGEGWHGTVISMEYRKTRSEGTMEHGGIIPGHFKFKKLKNIILEVTK